MKPEQINIAIAEHCGWKPSPGFIMYDGGRVDFTVWLDPDGAKHNDAPNYHGDLNAMHEAERDAEGVNEYAYYLNLGRSVLGRSICCESDHHRLPWATAAQRAEAFLRTIGKWIESQP